MFSYTDSNIVNIYSGGIEGRNVFWIECVVGRFVFEFYYVFSLFTNKDYVLNYNIRYNYLKVRIRKYILFHEDTFFK